MAITSDPMVELMFNLEAAKLALKAAEESYNDPFSGMSRRNVELAKDQLLEAEQAILDYRMASLRSGILRLIVKHNLQPK